MTKLISPLLLLSIAMNSVSAKPWGGIVPLESTRTEVEKLLDKPADPEQPRYYFANEIVTIEYSKYACGQAPLVKGWPTSPVIWNVKPDIVTVIRVDLRKAVLLSSLALNLSNFKRVPGYHLQNVFYYENRHEGFAIEVYEDAGIEMVRGYLYEPGAECDHLRCPGVKRPSQR